MDRPSLQRQGSRVRFAEGQEFVPSPPPPPSSTTATATSATNQGGGGPTAPSPPGVYWDDVDRDSTGPGGKTDNATSSSANYTFYREGTPPPHGESSDYEKLVLKQRDRERERERDRDVGGPGYPSVLSPVPIRPASAFPPYEATKFDPNDPGPGSDDDGGEGSLGRENREREEGEAAAAKRKRRRWIFIVLTLLFIAIPVGVGTGVALGMKRSGSSGSGSSAPATSPSVLPETEPISSETPIRTTTTSSPSASATEPPRLVPGLINCPQANNTLYPVPGSTKRFLRLCGIDYNGTDGAYDLSHIYTTSMEQCMDVCASNDLCTGCGWGMIEGDTKGNHRCWIKNNLQTPHKARDDYCFAVLQD